MEPPFWVKSSPSSHMPSTLVLRFIPDLELLEPPGLATASVAPNPWPPELAEFAAATARCPRMACREQGVTHTGSHELSTAARLATGPLAEAALLCLCDEELCDEEFWEVAAFPESLLELELDGLRLSRELENFHWGILGMSMQKVVAASCSPSRQGESASVDLAVWSRGGGGGSGGRGGSGGSGGRGRLVAETTGVATTLPLMAKLCIRSSEEVTDSLRKRPYFGFWSMPGGAA